MDSILSLIENSYENFNDEEKYEFIDALKYVNTFIFNHRHDYLKYIIKRDLTKIMMDFNNDLNDISKSKNNMLKVLNKIHNYDENKKQLMKNFLIYKNINIHSIHSCIILIEFENFTLIVGDEITFDNFNNFDDITLIIKNIFNNDNFKKCVEVWKNIYNDSKFFL